MERFTPDVGFEQVDSLVCSVAKMTPDPAGQWLRLDDVLRLAAVLRTVIDFAPSSQWISDESDRQRYRSATLDGVAILRRLGQ